MPGHMNVLLAEADVPYEQLKEMEEINPEMSRTDVAVVVGANDVTNPAAKNDPDSPIAGMPIIEVSEAQQVIVIKRSLSPGFAGIDNDLFYEAEHLDALRRRQTGGRGHRRGDREALGEKCSAWSLSRHVRGSERGQSTVEWVGLLLLVALVLAAALAAGLRLPGAALAESIASRILCVASLAGSCGDEPELIAAYGTEVGGLVRDHMPTLAFEQGSRALPVDWRRCRASACGDGSPEGAVWRTDADLPVTAFVHVVDRRPDGRACYIQYWLYYADSATFRGVPVAGEHGYHADDWESVQVRIGADGEVEQRASSHNGYNHGAGVVNWGSDAGIGPLRDLAEAIGARAPGGWGPETHVLVVSGGSHAGNIGEDPGGRFTPGRRVHLVPLEPIAASDSTTLRDLAALAQAGLARPRGRGDQLSATSAASAARRRAGSSRRSASGWRRSR